MNASKVPSRTVDKYDLSTRIIPGQKAFSLFTRRSNHRPIHGFRLSVRGENRHVGDRVDVGVIELAPGAVDPAPGIRLFVDRPECVHPNVVMPCHSLLLALM